ncbi:MAG: sulfur reduction protein DsrJ [Gammaproteobacteria bacterium]|nr:sulfur reduction protein DsrJ [Gammaproteobacteria bacterium]
MHSSTGIVRVAGVLLAGALTLIGGLASGDSAVTPGSRAAGMDACVAPTDVMRRNHMEFLKHDRDRTVRKGVRDIEYSLAACIGCHAAEKGNGDYHPVNDEGQFCSGCHEYVAVSLTCFQCHSKKPEQKMSTLGALQGELDGDRFSGLQPGAAAIIDEQLQRLHAISREVSR